MEELTLEELLQISAWFSRIIDDFQKENYDRANSPMHRRYIKFIDTRSKYDDEIFHRLPIIPNE